MTHSQNPGARAGAEVDALLAEQFVLPDIGEQAAALLPGSRVTAAFHHLSAVLLQDEAIEEIDTDVLVLGEARGDTDLVQALAGRIPGMRGVFAGRLRNAHWAVLVPAARGWVLESWNASPPEPVEEAVRGQDRGVD